ncbi:helix-turn-helix transcriptional regulator [Orbus mooreae]|uniref:helix-turn-helix transcriptional regulator n=1 Tax=Orbus mooreae TaxID=3074107 RepID=UPI00370DD5F4
MRRADRLFQIIQFLRTRQLTTASWLAEKLEVSERTIYRDMQDLISSGVPIDSEAGIGYILHKDYDLPPIMFDMDELTSLVIGAHMAISLGGKTQINAEKALSKLHSAMPHKQQRQIEKIQIYTPSFERIQYGTMIDSLNQAICQKIIVTVDYQKPQDNSSQQRSIYPLGIFFWGDKWTMVGRCLLRDKFRHFRLDRIKHYQLTDQCFTLNQEQTLQKFFSQIISV